MSIARLRACVRGCEGEVELMWSFTQPMNDQFDLVDATQPQ